MKMYRVTFQISKLGTGKDKRSQTVNVAAHDEQKAYTQALFGLSLDKGEVIDSYDIKEV